MASCQTIIAAINTDSVSTGCGK